MSRMRFAEIRKYLSIKYLVFCLLALVACGGTSSQTAPTPTPVTPAPAPTPQPSYPNMLGTWGGTLTIVASAGNQSASNTCTHTWNVTSQTDGVFTGTFQLTGGTTVACAQAGNVSGTVDITGHLTGVSLGVVVGVNAACVRTSGTGLFVGQLSGSVLSVTESEGVVCSGVPATRNLTITVGR